MAGIYIHIPFCKHKCNYCNFFSLATLRRKDEIVDAIIKEIGLQKDYLNQEIETIYFGGGTPTLLTPNDIDRILDKLSNTFSFTPSIEITIESNPDDLTDEMLEYLKDSLINRLSIGIQSFRSEDLIYLERKHNMNHALKSIEKSIAAGFENISIDLIYGIPTMTNANWNENLSVFADLDLPHLSAYALTVEPKTILKWQIDKGKNASPKEESTIQQFDLLMDFAEKHSLEHYEISNFAKKGMYSQHNKSYWEQKPYLGIGPSAHSYNGNSRQWNVSSLNKYIEGVEHQNLDFEIEFLEEKQKFNEQILTEIRTMWGLNLSSLRDDYNPKFFRIFERNLNSIETNLVYRQNDRLTLSREGKHLADGISASLFIE